MAKYEPSGKCGAGGALAVAGIGIGAALGLGVAVHFIGRFFYLILLMPVLWGLAIGLAAAGGVRVGKRRSAALALAVGAIGGLLSYGLYHLLDNAYVRSEVKKEIARQMEEPGDVDALYDMVLRTKYGKAGFFGELAMRAEMGMSIGRPGRSTESKPLVTGIGMYIYWGIELLAVAGVACLLPLGAVREPFCEPCGKWYVKAELARVAEDRLVAAQGALQGRDFVTLAGCRAPSGPGVLTVGKCPACAQTPVRLILEMVVQDGKGKEKRQTLFDDMITREEAGKLGSA
jgi:hypothetical protein